MNDPYEVLGVAPTATTAEIRAAYRDGTRRLHPDHGDGVAPDHAAFTALVDAWTVLRDPRARSEFDGSCQSGESPPAWTPPDEPMIVLDPRSSRMLRQAFVIAIVIVTIGSLVLFVVGMSQSGGR